MDNGNQFVAMRVGNRGVTLVLLRRVPLAVRLDRAVYNRTPNNNVMHAKPDLRVLLKWMIAGSGSVITDVICLDVTIST